jgi:hypothetical protein
MKRPVSGPEVQLEFSHVLYGGSKCLKENDVYKRKSRETSERSEEVELEVNKYELEGEEAKLRWAS